MTSFDLSDRNGDGHVDAQLRVNLSAGRCGAIEDGPPSSGTRVRSERELQRAVIRIQRSAEQTGCAYYDRRWVVPYDVTSDEWPAKIE
jgi:hypothetical protein